HLDFLDVRLRERAADFHLDALRGGFAGQGAVIAPHIVDDRVVEAITAATRGLRVDAPMERNHGDFGGAASDIQNHRTAGLTDRNAGTDRRRHRFLDQENVARAGALRRLLDGATLDLGGAAWHTYQNPGARSEHARAMHLANELLEHLLGHGKVGDDAILQRSYRDDVARRSAKHLLGVRAHCGDAARAARSAVLPNRNHRWLVEDDSLPANVNQG